MPKSVFARGSVLDPAMGELTTLPRPSSWLERGHPSPYPIPFGTDTLLALAMWHPQNSSQIYTYANIALQMEYKRNDVIYSKPS